MGLLLLLLIPGVAAVSVHPGGSIQDAIDTWGGTDTIVVEPGYYSGPLIVGWGTTLIANGSVTIDGGGTGTVLQVNGDSVHVSGFLLINSGPEPIPRDSCLAITGMHVVVRDVEMTGCGLGLFTDQAYDVDMLDLTIRDTVKGVDIDDSSDLLFLGTIIDESEEDCMRIRGHTSRIRVEAGTFSNCDAGVYVTTDHDSPRVDLTINGTHISHLRRNGIRVQELGRTAPVVGITIQNTTISNTTGAAGPFYHGIGIALAQVRDVIMENVSVLDTSSWGTFSHPSGAYTISDISDAIRVVDAWDVTVRGVYINGSEQAGLVLELVENFSIRDVLVENVNSPVAAGISFLDVRNGSIDDVELRWINGHNQSFGLGIFGSMDVTGGNIHSHHNMREGITMSSSNVTLHNVTTTDNGYDGITLQAVNGTFTRVTTMGNGEDGIDMTNGRLDLVELVSGENHDWGLSATQNILNVINGTVQGNGMGGLEVSDGSFLFQGLSISDHELYGIYPLDTSGSIVDTVIEDTRGAGIYIAKVLDIDIRNVTIIDPGHMGIHVDEWVRNLVIEECTIRTVDGNGIYFRTQGEYDDVTIDGLNLEGMGDMTGITLMGEIGDFTITNSSVVGMNTGIRAGAVGHIMVRDVVFRDNVRGIVITAATTSTSIQGSMFEDNYAGIVEFYRPPDVTVEWNTFMNSTVSVLQLPANDASLYRWNLWSGYLGSDTGDGGRPLGDGIGDTDLPHAGVDMLPRIDDSDGDGYPDLVDRFPGDPEEWSDIDRDGVGDNGDAFPDNPRWHSDSDGDGISDDVDEAPFDPDLSQDSDGDGVDDSIDAFPLEPTQTEDGDGDGFGDSLSGRYADSFPEDPGEWVDTDGDGEGDNGDNLPSIHNGIFQAATAMYVMGVLARAVRNRRSGLHPTTLEGTGGEP